MTYRTPSDSPRRRNLAPFTPRSTFSEPARDLIRKLLTADKTQRYGACAARGCASGVQSRPASARYSVRLT
jgi:hypothetical protein